MSKKITPAYLQELGHKFRSGTITPEEQKDFDQWYTKQAENKLTLPDGYAASSDALKTKLYANIQQQLGLVELENTTPKRFVLWKRFAAAAAILLVLGTSSYFLFKNTQDKNETAITQTILPGSNKATLTLGNGTKISLTDAANGQVALQNGIVIKKTAEGQLIYEATASNSEETVEYNTIEAPAGGQWQVILPDQSKVWLNASSKITYPTRFTGKERKVEINGEAYFEVAHNKAMPFRVQSKGQLVEVLGTHFNVMAYGDEKTIKTTLLEGAVKVTTNGKSQLLGPGQQAQVSGQSIALLSHVDLEEVVAWKNGYFKFNENLENIMAKVARWYDVEVIYEYKPDQNITFTGELPRNQNIKSLLNAIEYNGDVHFKIEGRRIIVTK